MTRKIMFRADAKPSIGVGDLMSFISLSRYFENYGWECHFATRDYDSALKILNAYKIKKSMLITQSSGIKNEVEKINHYLELHDINAIFMQINENKLSKYTAIKNDIFKACAYFDYDLPKGYDLVLSWDVNSRNYFKKYRNSETKFFTGPEYVILPANFNMPSIEKRAYNRKRRRLLVLMGGADEFNFTLKIAKKLNNLKCGMEITFLLGYGYPYLKELKSVLKLSNLRYKIRQNCKNMLNEYMNHDIAIGSGGLTISELVASRTPAIIIAMYEHQITRCRYFNNLGLVKYLGFKNIEHLKNSDLEGFYPSRNNQFSIKINDVVKYINEACS